MKRQKQRYYEENRDRLKAKASAWGKANRERRREIVNASYYRHLEANRQRGIQYHARRRAAGGYHARDDEYVAILRNDPCCYCGAPMEHIDHIVPVKAGGTSEWENLTAACAACNHKKNAKPLLHFMLEQT